jgi:hypothetical protein
VRRTKHPRFPAAISRRPHPIPSRTRKLSSSEPMVLHGKPCGRVGRCRDLFPKELEPVMARAFCFLSAGLCRMRAWLVALTLAACACGNSGAMLDGG